MPFEPGTLAFLLHIPSQYTGDPIENFLILSRYNYTSSMHLVNRLTSRNLHLLALRISTYLSLKPDAVLKHWACVKITKSKPSATGVGRGAELQGDDEVCQSIVKKFSQLGGSSVSYADIAKKAWEVGRLDLATKARGPRYSSQYNVLTEAGPPQLLDHEQHASDQVPLLLNMKEDRLALIKAVDSGDTDLGEQVSYAYRTIINGAFSLPCLASFA